MSTQKIGIALAGGGARGIAHIGVLAALEELDFTPQVFSGASAGALIGALYAAGNRPQDLLDICVNTSLFSLFRPTLFSFGLADLSRLKSILAEHIEEDSFESLARPLHISLTNLSKGCPEIRSRGPLFDVVVASCSIPILFKAQELGGDLYADGGVMNNLPVEPLREQCDFVIGVNVNPIFPNKELSGLKALTYRTLELVLWTNVEARLASCDLAIEPHADSFKLFDLSKAEEIYALGHQAACETIQQYRSQS